MHINYLLRRIGVSTCLLTLLITCEAQSDGQKIEYAVDYVSIKLTFFYLDDYVKSHNVEQANFLDLQKETGVIKINELLDSANFSRLLTKYSFKQTDRRLTSKIYAIKRELPPNSTQLGEEIFGRAVNVYSNPNFPVLSSNFKDSLKQTLNSYFAPDLPANTNQDKTTTGDSSKKDVGSKTDLKSPTSNNLMFLLISFIIGLLLGGVASYFFIAKKFQSKIHSLKRDIDGFKSQNEQLSSALDKEKAVNANSGNNGAGDDKNHKPNQPDTKNAVPVSVATDSTSTMTTGSQPLEVSKQNTIQQLLFYMSVPYNDGSFLDKNRSSEFIEQVHNYKLVIMNPNQTKARLEFMNSPTAIGKATESPHTYIYPVFDESHLQPKTFKSIKIIKGQSGLWELVDGTWVMKTKAKIKYE